MKIWWGAGRLGFEEFTARGGNYCKLPISEGNVKAAPEKEERNETFKLQIKKEKPEGKKKGSCAR